MSSSNVVLGFRFDLDKVNQSNYEEECWRIFWKSVGADRFIGYPVSIHEGLTEATKQGKENVYCILIHADVLMGEQLIHKIKTDLFQDSIFDRFASKPRYSQSIEDSFTHTGDFHGKPSDHMGNVYNTWREDIPKEFLCHYCETNEPTEASNYSYLKQDTSTYTSGRKQVTRTTTNKITILRCNDCKYYHEQLAKFEKDTLGCLPGMVLGVIFFVFNYSSRLSEKYPLTAQ